MAASTAGYITLERKFTNFAQLHLLKSLPFNMLSNGNKVAA